MLCCSESNKYVKILIKLPLLVVERTCFMKNKLRIDRNVWARNIVNPLLLTAVVDIEIGISFVSFFALWRERKYSFSIANDSREILISNLFAIRSFSN
jgi:hypothetical protein